MLAGRVWSSTQSNTRHQGKHVAPTLTMERDEVTSQMLSHLRLQVGALCLPGNLLALTPSACTPWCGLHRAHVPSHFVFLERTRNNDLLIYC